MDYRVDTRTVKPAIVVPTFNHGGQVIAVLDGLAPLGHPIIVVDDGSTDETARALLDWERRNPDLRLIRYRHDGNMGKAAALRTGFAATRRLVGVTHAVTIDSDGQLDPADICRLMEVAEQRPSALVLGSRPCVMANCPGRCSLGRRAASLAVRGQTGLRLADTQCGLRAYPLELLDAVRCVSGRYAFEAEVITRAAWAGFTVVEVPVSCRYFDGSERVSHYRPLVDSLKHGAMHVRLLLRALAPWRCIRSPGQPRSGRASGRWTSFAVWISPARCWRDARSSELGRLEFAAALGIGAWIGAQPFFGLHAVMGVYAAWRLHLHPAPMILGTQISVPPVGVALAATSVWVGHLLLTGRVVSPDVFALDWRLIPQLAWHWFPAWLVGSLVVGFVLGLVVFGLALAIAPPARSVKPSAV